MTPAEFREMFTSLVENDPEEAVDLAMSQFAEIARLRLKVTP